MKVDQQVLQVLSSANAINNTLTLQGQLDRKLYERANKVLEAAGGKWNRRAKAHVFAGDAGEAVEQILLTGAVTRPQDFGYFPTPETVVDRLLELAGIQPGMVVLEPSAGQGAIVRQVAAITKVDCVELLPHHVDILRKQGYAREVCEADFLQMKPSPVYDRVVMNPPFKQQADIRHVLHALAFLKPDGLLIAVMSAGITFRTNTLTENFRSLVAQRGGVIEACPDGAFSESGTAVNTVIVVVPAVDCH